MWRFPCVFTASMVVDRRDREFYLSLILLQPGYLVFLHISLEINGFIYKASLMMSCLHKPSEVFWKS